MKQTIKRLAEQVTRQAADLAKQADALGDDPGISGAESVLHARDAQQAMNRAIDALKLAIAQRAERPAVSQGAFADDDAA